MTAGRGAPWPTELRLKRAEKRLDEKSVKRLCGILAERGENDRRRDDRQPDRKDGRGKRPELRSAAAGIKPKQL